MSPTSDPEREDTGGRAGSFVRAGLAALILLAPLPFGSVGPVPVLAIELAAAALGAAAVWIVLRDPHALPTRARRALVPAAVVLAIGLVQLVPVPRAIVRTLAGPTADARAIVGHVAAEADPAWAPLSLSPPDTLDALLRFAAYALIGFAACVAVRRRSHARTLAYAIVASAAFQAVYGSVEYLSGHQHIFGYAKRYYLDSATGTFVNRNHYASFLAMALPFALVGLASGRGRGRSGEPRPSWRRRVVALSQLQGARTLLLALAACTIVTAVFLSFSRGGLAAALLGALVTLAAKLERRTAVVVALVVFLLPAAWLGWQEVRAPGERFFGSGEVQSLTSRLVAWEAASDTLPAYAALGSGLGTFEAAFVMVKPATLDQRWTHLHNDWLESLFEGGALALLSVLILPALLLFGGRPESSVSSAAVAALAAIAFHSTVDFALRIPANAVLVAIALGLLACARRSRTEPSPPHRPVPVPRP